MESPGAPAVGGTDLQLDAARVAVPLWGPDLIAGNARLRHTVEPGVSVEADAGVLHVTNPGQAGDRNGYTGRLGVLLHSQDRRRALGAGVGGGMSATAGPWGAADVHGVIGGAHRYVRPMLGAGVGYSAPFGDKTFVVNQTSLRLPRNVFTQVSLGVELGPPDKALVLGASMLRFWPRESSVVSSTAGGADPSEIFVAAGVGLRLAMN